MTTKMDGDPEQRPGGLITSEISSLRTVFIDLPQNTVDATIMVAMWPKVKGECIILHDYNILCSVSMADYSN